MTTSDGHPFDRDALHGELDLSGGQGATGLLGALRGARQQRDATTLSEQPP